LVLSVDAINSLNERFAKWKKFHRNGHLK
jgi:hypothetical protein